MFLAWVCARIVPFYGLKTVFAHAWSVIARKHTLFECRRRKREVLSIFESNLLDFSHFRTPQMPPPQETRPPKPKVKRKDYPPMKPPPRPPSITSVVRKAMTFSIDNAMTVPCRCGARHRCRHCAVSGRRGRRHCDQRLAAEDEIPTCVASRCVALA